MKQILKNIQAVISDDIDSFRKTYRDTLKSDVKLLDTVIAYVSKRKGKQIRPILTLLSARLCGESNGNTHVAAALIEILHVATLVHDDVVDDADIRRGFPSVKRIWKNKIAILVGDFMFSKALTNMIRIKDFEALQVLSTTAERLSEGELLQMEKAKKKDMSERIYYQMVSDKTASLISAACELGAITTTEDVQKRKALRDFGEKFGIAFQIKDDLFDILGNVSQMGKNAGFDVKRNMLTLPLLHLFSNLENREKQKLQRQLRNHARRNELEHIKKIIIEHGGVEYTEQKIREISEQALQVIAIFPESQYKSALTSLIDFNINRKF